MELKINVNNEHEFRTSEKAFAQLASMVINNPEIEPQDKSNVLLMISAVMKLGNCKITITPDDVADVGENVTDLARICEIKAGVYGVRRPL